MHLVLRNALPPEVARRSVHVRVLDGRGARHARRRRGPPLRRPARRRCSAPRLVDTGSGYNAQSDIPVHFGLPSMAPVDVEVTWPAAGRRVVRRVTGISPGRGVVVVRI
jgi:hypothetical protein